MTTSQSTCSPTWQWKTWQGLPYLTCSLLEPWLHGFFTQQFSPRSPADLVKVLDPAVSTYRIRQVHGNTVLMPSEVEQFQQELSESSASGDEEIVFPPADGLLTEQAGQAVWVCSADCAPVLIADVETGQTAAVHAGWRGTAGEIVPRAIARLQSQGSKLHHLRVALGPAIAGEVYQVSTTVAAEVGLTVVQEIAKSVATPDPELILSALRELPESPLLSDPQPGRARLDVRRVNALQLEQAGILTEHIAIAPYCTYQHTEHFFSYRRDRLKQVQWSGIVSRG
ncbi:MAG: peptidoglycan editing factor PgeF [Leptolyngbyaceae cyanobacterium SM1_4_3]|nr:peptidoglycan editing factor PgeF [Leptolyngbyaceae cyanobacterium SM1_4_3]